MRKSRMSAGMRVVPRSFRPFCRGGRAFFIFLAYGGVDGMRERLEALRDEALQELGGVEDPGRLNDLRVKYLGKKGALTEILRGMGALSAEERPVVGQAANDVRGAIEQVIE